MNLKIYEQIKLAQQKISEAKAKAVAEAKAKADAEAKAVAEAKAKAKAKANAKANAEKQKQLALQQQFNKTNEYLEDNYFLSLLKTIGWKFNNLFTPDDKENIKKSVLISDEEATLLTTTGTTSSNADERNQGMWMKLNKSITGNKDTTEHYFENIYKKLACCSGKSQITVPILKRNQKTGEIERVYKTIKIDRKGECTMNGLDWADDNTTEKGYKPHCEDLMQRLIAFLSKYDSKNPMIDSYGGCLANKHLNAIDEDILKDPFLLNLVNINRSCLMPTCNKPDAYKRKQDRKSCTTTICQAKIGVSEAQAGGAISVFGNQIEQQCGPQSELSQSLSKGEEKANEIIAEKEEEVNNEIQKIDEELEKADEIIDKKVVNEGVIPSNDFLNQLSLFFSNFFQSFFSLFQMREGFLNFNIDYLNKISNINYPKYLFLCVIFIIIPMLLLNTI
jgi:hypothetical protein